MAAYKMKCGIWESYGGWFRCSECAHMPDGSNIETIHVCPNCGANMTAYDKWNSGEKRFDIILMEESND